MTPDDYKTYQHIWPMWSSEDKHKKIATLSFNTEQIQLLQNVFPSAIINHYNISTWNLNRSNENYYDLILACNVFHYAPDPQLWFTNVMKSCDAFWIQDLINRNRGSSFKHQFGDDNDCMRYSYKEHNSLASNSFNLKNLINDNIYVNKFHHYKDGPNDFYYYKTNDHFIAEIVNG